MKKLLLPFFLLFCLATNAQLPHEMTPAERALWPSYYSAYGSRSMRQTGIAQAPVSPVRAPAEWEEIDYLMVTWTSYPAILKEIVRAAQQETGVIIICSDSNVVKTALLAAPAVNLTGVHYLLAPFNSIWARDYGQWNMYTHDVDSLLLFDWIYNRPRPRDDTVPSAIARFTGLPLYLATTPPNDLVHTGGNFMVDGFGTAFSSNLVLNENATKTPAQIDSIMQAYFGITRYIRMPTLPYDAIHHIDMHLKLLDEETLLVGQYPTGISDGPQIEANLLYILSNFQSVYGTPYKVVRIPMPPDGNGLYPNAGGDYRTYTNSVFINKTVLVPTYDPQYDSTALRIYREALPGYTITGIDCNAIIPNLGAVHCITKEVSAANPLLVMHQPLHDTDNTTNPYAIQARILHRSGIDSAFVYFRTDTTQPWIALPMSQSGTTWTAMIPPQAVGTHIYYYIQAYSVSGKQQVKPITAPTGYYVFTITAPVAVHEVANVFSAGKPFPNPAHGIACIPLNCSIPAQGRVYVTDLAGRFIRELANGSFRQGENLFFVDAASLSAGMYLVVFESGNNRCVQRLAVN